jgi:hypothetical protein
MRKPVGARKVGVILVGGHVLLGASFAAAFISLRRLFGHADDVPLLAVAMSQAGLIGLWAGLAKARASRRWAGAIAGGAFVDASFTITIEVAQGPGGPEDWAMMAAFTLAPLTAIGILGAVLNRCGFAIERLVPDAANRSWRPAQFSLFHLFAVTLVAAILFTLVRGLRAQSPVAATAWEIGLLASFNALLFVLHTQICLWSALGAGHWAFRWGAFVLSAALAAGIFGLAIGGRQDTFVPSIVLMAVYSLVTGGTLSVLRKFGYRLVRYGAHAGIIRAE